MYNVCFKRVIFLLIVVMLEFVSWSMIKMYIRGQVIKVKSPWVKAFVCNIDIDENGRVCYIYPNQNQVILGGTKEVNNGDLQAQAEESYWIMRSTQESIPRVGLRPGRTNIRLEKEIVNMCVNGDTKIGIIIHNFVLDASGIILSW